MKSLAIHDLSRAKEYQRGRLCPINDDAMEPTLVCGGYAIVSPVDRMNADRVYALDYNGAIIFRRCQMWFPTKEIRVWSDNPNRGDVCFMPYGRFNEMCLGHVIGQVSKV